MSEDSQEAEAGQDPGFEVTSRDQFNITFRTHVVFPVKTPMYITATPTDADPIDVQVMIRSAFVLDDDRVEYTGKMLSAPADFAQWTGSLALRDHRAVEAPAPRQPVVEQRRDRRLTRTFQVMSKDLQRFKALSADISETGLRLMADEPLPVGKVLDLTLDFDDSQLPHLKCKAEVVWCRPKDARYWWVGLRFTAMSPEHRTIAIEYIRFCDQAARRRPPTTDLSTA